MSVVTTEFKAWEFLRKFIPFKKHWTPRFLYHRIIWFFYVRFNPGLPWLTQRAIRFLKANLKPSDRGLEFGSGRSTLWFGKMIGNLISIEHNPEWHENVKNQLAEQGIRNVDLRLTTLTHYTDVLKEIEDNSLDFILDDGMEREECAVQSVPKLKSGGILVIDNAEWYFPSPHKVPGRGPFHATLGWKAFDESVRSWKRIWTTNGVWDTLILIKP